jgi:hypothetical protein
MYDSMSVEIEHGQDGLDGHIDDVLGHQSCAYFSARGSASDLNIRADPAGSTIY